MPHFGSLAVSLPPHGRLRPLAPSLRVSGAGPDAGFQPAFRVDRKGSSDNHTLTRLNAMENLDPFAETPSRFDLARLEDAFPCST